VRSVHSRGYVIGDVNESNVLVAEDAIVTLVDTDSFQVNDGTTVYRCTVGKPEYTPPELQGMSFRDVDRSVEHDLFGLGVLIYQLLMEGTHPFGGVFTGQGEAPELQDRIKSGHFPHGRRGIPYKPMPLAPSFQMLPVALQELFLLCFEQGHGNPAVRPTAEVWSKALGEAEDGLVRCGVNGQHFYSGHLGVCPWCERAVKLGGRDPFPALGVISSGQHLKPAAIGKAVGKPILKPFFPSNMSGTQQSQIASLQSHTITNSQASTTISSTTYTPQPTQTNYVNNQTSTKITLWEALLNPTVSLGQRIAIFLVIPSWLCLTLLFLIVFIIVDIDTIWRVSFVGVCFYSFVTWVYLIFIKNVSNFISFSTTANSSNFGLIAVQILWSIALTTFILGSCFLSATFVGVFLVNNLFVSNIFMSGVVFLIVTCLHFLLALNILIFLARKRILHWHLFL